MPQQDAKRLCKRHRNAMKRNDQWRDTWKDAYRYTLPMRNVLENPTEGQRKGDFVFDSTGVNSLNKFANRMQDLIFPRGQDFIQLEPGPRFAAEKPPEDLKKQLEVSGERFHGAIWKSNFSNVVNESLVEIGVGTSAMLFNEGPDDNPFHFHSVPIPMVALEPGPWGTVGMVSREQEMPVDEIKNTWPGVQIPEAEAKKAEGDPEHKLAVIEVTYADDATRQQAGSMAPTRWFYDVIDKNNEVSFLPEQKTFDFASPWVVTRWTKAANEVHGRGPVLHALPDIRTVNKVVELILKNASLSVAGVWTAVNDGVLNPNMVRIVPGATIPVGRNPGHPQGASLAALERAGSFDVAQIILEDMRMSIKQALFDNQLPEPAASVRSATEFIQRMRELFVDIGPAGGRIINEMIEPIVFRGLHILSRKGQLELPPGFDLNSQNITIRVLSPLARQQALDELQRVFQWIDLVSTLGEQIMLTTVKVEEIPAYVHEQLQVPTRLLRDETERGGVEELVRGFVSQALEAEQPTAPLDGQGNVPSAPPPFQGPGNGAI